MVGKIQIVSRTGNDTASSSSAPYSITFSFVPVVVIGLGGNGTTSIHSMFVNRGSNITYGASALVVDKLTTSYQSGSFGYISSSSDDYAYAVYAKRSSNSKTIYFYGSYSNVVTLGKTDGTVYRYLGIG